MQCHPALRWAVLAAISRDFCCSLDFSYFINPIYWGRGHSDWQLGSIPICFLPRNICQVAADAVMEFVETLLSSETSTSWNGLVWHIPPTLVRKLRPGHQRFLSITPYLFRPKLRSLFQSSLPLQHNLL